MGAAKTLKTSQKMDFPRVLVQCMKIIIDRAIKQSEAAVTQITEKLQTVSNLSQAQKDQISGALEGYYNSDEGNDLKSKLNDDATRIMEAVAAGDMELVDKITSDPEYQKARKSTKKLHDKLQDVLRADTDMSSHLMPVLVALQFQDSLRQELESMTKCFDDYFNSENKLSGLYTDDKATVEFWQKLAQNFANTQVRKDLLRTALGPSYQFTEQDVNESSDTGDAFFFKP